MLGAERGGTVKGRLGFRSAIWHEPAGLDAELGHAVRTRTVGEEDFDHVIVHGPIGHTEGRMQRSLAGIRERVIHVGTLLDEKLAKLPVPVKGCAVQIEVVSERLQR